ncbi:MAG: arginase family protein [Bdellovibrionales bacterium]
MVPKIRLFDLPTNAGCLELGTENLPSHFRENGLIDRLVQRGYEVEDLGRVEIPVEPRHNQPPIRNFPLSQEVWRRSETFLEKPFLAQSLSLILGLGGDCSMVVGTTSSAAKVFKGNVHLLYLDGDVDSIAPDPEKCMGSAGMGLWFLTQKSTYWDGAQLSPSQITVLGNKKAPDTDLGIPFVSLAELRCSSIHRKVNEVLASIPAETSILVHFDVDLLSAAEMPAAYAPRDEGFNLTEVEEMLSTILMDSRVRYLEVSEFMPSKDPTGQSIQKLIGLITRSLPNLR